MNVSLPSARGLLRTTVLGVLLMAMGACTKYRHFDYARAEVALGGWVVRAGLAGTWTYPPNREDATADRGSPYTVWLGLHQVPSPVAVSFEDVVLQSKTEHEITTVLLDTAIRENGAFGRSADPVDLEYVDYILTARVKVVTASGVVERTVELTINRSYSEEHSDAITDFIMSI